MIEKHVNWFVDEVQKHREKYESADSVELSEKITRILKAFIFKNLRLQNPRTYSLTFTENYVPIDLDSLHQTRCALATLIDLIVDAEFLTLPYSKDPRSTLYYSRTERDIRDSFEVFEELFHNYPGQIDAILKDLNQYLKLLSEEGLEEKLRMIDGGLENEIIYLENLQDHVLTLDNFKLFYGNEGDVMIARLQRLLNSKVSKKELLSLQDEIRRNIEVENAFSDIFTPNGFRLFDYLMQNHLSTGIGRLSDVAFFYRMMNEREMVPLIHAKQTPFKLFVNKKYSGFEPDWKFKSWNVVNTEKRRQAYSTAKSVIGLK